MVGHHEALIYSMVLAAAADRDMTDSEINRMGEIVKQLPIFGDFDIESLPGVAAECAKLLGPEDGLANAFDQIKQALPDRLRETAYALACEIVAADQQASQEELRLLELLRHAIGVGRLPAAAIERGAAARYAHF